MPLSGRVAIIAPPHSTRTTIAYGSPSGAATIGSARQIPRMKAGLARRVHAKLLNMRDFQALSRFPSQLKRATTRRWQLGKSTGMAFHAKTRHWLGQVSCLHAADPSMM
jgi:hypothetical protein